MPSAAQISNKPKILWVGEATFLSTGYATYGREVLTRLHSTGKYDIAELGVFGSPIDSRRFDIPWKYYGNLPESKDLESDYDSQMSNKFGLWRFESVVLDFKPDIVISISDWWMFEFIDRSPFRRFFKWIIMPAIDSTPQAEQWLDTYHYADAVLAYCEFGKEEMERSRVKVANIASPSADYTIFHPVEDKKAHKESLGIMPNVNIIGTVMRNQKRKLYPDLFQAFRDYCIKYPDLSRFTFLYAHTAYPDIGWNIPQLLKIYEIGHKVLFTYACRHCGHFFPSFFHDAVQVCPKCKHPEARMPDPDHGLSPTDLGRIMQCFDLYIQYSSAGGFEMPIVEAAACGVPCIAIDYSAMASVIRNVKGTPIKPLHLNFEPEGHYYRAIPNNAECTKEIAGFFIKSSAEKNKDGMNTYRACRAMYSWGKTAKVWEATIDSLKGPSDSWDAPPRLANPNIPIPAKLSNEEFTRLCISQMLGRPDYVNRYLTLRIIRDLNYGKAMTGHGGLYYNEMSTLGVQQFYRKFNRENVITELTRIAERHNEWEQKRCGLGLNYTPHFIDLMHEDTEKK